MAAGSVGAASVTALKSSHLCAHPPPQLPSFTASAAPKLGRPTPTHRVGVGAHHHSGRPQCALITVTAPFTRTASKRERERLSPAPMLWLGRQIEIEAPRGPRGNGKANKRDAHERSPFFKPKPEATYVNRTTNPASRAPRHLRVPHAVAHQSVSPRPLSKPQERPTRHNNFWSHRSCTPATPVQCWKWGSS